MPDPLKILKSDSANCFLTGKFGNLLLTLLRPIFNLRVFDANGVEQQVLWADANLHIVLKPKSVAAATTAAPFRWFRGEYVANPVSPTTGQPDPYLAQQMVVIRGGSYAGTYVCVADNPTLSPWQGVQWVSIAPANAIGQWT